jgi:hypothetical protein
MGATLQSGTEVSVPTQLVNAWGLPALNTLLLHLYVEQHKTLLNHKISSTVQKKYLQFTLLISPV